ncbi:MAG: ATP-binding protein [Mobilicoccus sp.]|nr:ATP-binding protein [Mobilicoccus sp.]
MSRPPAGTVLVLGRSDFVAAAVEEVESHLSGRVPAHAADGPAELAAWSTDIPVVLALLMPGEGQNVDDLVDAVLAHPACFDPRILLVTERTELDDMSRALDSRHVNGVIAIPWTPGMLASYADAQLSRWLRQHRESPTRPLPIIEVGSDLLRHLEMPVDEAAADLLLALEEALGPRPRLHLPAGVDLAHEGMDIDQVFIVEQGRVRLTVTSPLAGTVVLNHASTGPVVGLVALADRRGSMVTATTTTACRLVPLTIEQLDRALATHPRVGAALTALSIRVLSHRLRKAQHRRVEKTELAARLRQTLHELELAREELLAQTRLATLGEMAAGLAHELNNPIAAVTRSTEHILTDLPGLVGDDTVAVEVLDRARAHGVLDARSQRAARRALGEVVDDPVLVRRLVAAGITDAADARRLLAAGESVETLELAAGVGSALHTLQMAAGHITTLVDGLRQQARPDVDGAARTRVDVPATVRRATQLLGPRVGTVTVDVAVDGAVGEVLGSATQLTQVWTNLLTNAVDALDGEGTVRVRVSEVDRRWVRVTVLDDGPGVPDELQERIFEPRFTTKSGVVRFGLGLGLGICRRIVDAHGGSIELESHPGRTCFEVRLPVAETGEDQP